MEANELRIGNLLEFTEGEYCKVKFIGEKTVTIELPTKTVRTTIEDVSSIPLTEEWLIKFGFKSDGTDTDFWEKENVSGTLFDSDFELTWYEYSPCKYVHQLQNLYHALTGKEVCN